MGVAKVSPVPVPLHLGLGRGVWEGLTRSLCPGTQQTPKVGTGQAGDHHGGRRVETQPSGIWVFVVVNALGVIEFGMQVNFFNTFYIKCKSMIYSLTNLIQFILLNIVDFIIMCYQLLSFKILSILAFKPF